MPTRVEVDFHTHATPEDVVELLTDLTPERPKRWPALYGRWYEVADGSVSTADVREGGGETDAVGARGV